MFCGFGMFGNFDLGCLGVVADNITHGACLEVCMFWEVIFGGVFGGLFGDFWGIVGG